MNYNHIEISDIYTNNSFLINEAFVFLGSSTPILFLTIIDSRQFFEIGKLDTFDIINFKRRLRANLQRADIKIAVGLIELCLRIDYRSGDQEPNSAWWPHIHIIVQTKHSGDHIRGALAKYYPRDRDRNRIPILIKPIYDIKRLSSYISKDSIQTGRIIKNYDRDSFRPKHGRLPAAQILELSQFLNKITQIPCGKGSLIYALGVRRSGDNWHFCPKSPKK